MKRLCYWKRKAWYRLLSSSGLKKNCVCFHHQASFWSLWNISYENNCAHLKMKANFISATQYHKVHVFSPWWMLVLKVSRRNTNFFWSFKLPLCGLVRNVRFLRNIYTCLWTRTYLLTEGGRSFKTFLKESYAVALDGCYLFTKKC